MAAKGRKKKVRYIQEMPKIAMFSPRGRPGRPDSVELTVDQYEAIRLADLQGYHQVEAAQFMGISRPSFGRILKVARKIIADALVNGKSINIRISDVQVGVTRRILPNKHSTANQKIRNTIKTEETLRKTMLNYSKTNKT